MNADTHPHQTTADDFMARIVRRAAGLTSPENLSDWVEIIHLDREPFATALFMLLLARPK
jgi:hypothetical protein